MAILDVFKKKNEENKKPDEKLGEVVGAKVDADKEVVKKSSKTVILKKKKIEKTTEKSKSDENNNSTYNNIILRPHITEKGAVVADHNAYTFEVTQSTNKSEIKKAIKAIYKVEPISVNIVNLPRKNVFSRGKKGMTAGKKKALVFLKNGETIEYV